MEHELPDGWAELSDADWDRIEAEHRAYLARNRRATPGWSGEHPEDDNA